MGESYHFPVGTAVRIRKDSCYYGEDSINNPADLTGTIIEGNRSRYLVLWPTGEDNSYSHEDLELAPEVVTNYEVF